MHFDFLMHDIFGNAEYKAIKQYCSHTLIKNVTKKIIYSALCKMHVLFIIKTFLLIFSAFVINGSPQPSAYKTLKLKIACQTKKKGQNAEMHHLKLALCVFGIRNAYDFILTELWKTLSKQTKKILNIEILKCSIDSTSKNQQY